MKDCHWDMPSIESILSNGFFFRELPPAFTSVPFANLIVNNRNRLPPEFSATNPKCAQLQRHSVARLGITRRNMFIPNPVPFFRLCQVVSSNFNVIDQHCRLSTFSNSTPIDNPESGRSIITEYSLGELTEPRSHLRSSSKYILKTDISKCFPSIYTHSIPWALHGKSYAKENRNNQQLLGNLMDRSIRNCQDRQTSGIPIGPDTSLVIAEIVLSAIDVKLSNELPYLNGFRHMDDYEFGFKRYSEAENTLATLQEFLQEYELELNFEKTKIIKLPLPLEKIWVTNLRTFVFRETPRSQRYDLINYFSHAYKLSEEYPNEFVLRYSVARLRSIDIFPSNWDLMQDFLIQCLMVEPGVFLLVLERLMDAHDKGLQVDQSKLEDVINFQIKYHSPSGHASEIAWALWALIFWSISMSTDAANAISNVDDSIVALLAIDAEQRGLIPSGLDKTLWLSYMNEQDLYERQWLLSYEANVKGWLPSASASDHVLADNAFGYLKTNSIEFYDSERLLTFRPAATSGAGVWYSTFSQIEAI